MCPWPIRGTEAKGTRQEQCQIDSVLKIERYTKSTPCADEDSQGRQVEAPRVRDRLRAARGAQAAQAHLVGRDVSRVRAVLGAAQDGDAEQTRSPRGGHALDARSARCGRTELSSRAQARNASRMMIRRDEMSHVQHDRRTATYKSEAANAVWVRDHFVGSNCMDGWQRAEGSVRAPTPHLGLQRSRIGASQRTRVQEARTMCGTHSLSICLYLGWRVRI